MNILITGNKGFIASNFIIRLKTNKKYNLFLYNRKSKEKSFINYLKKADIIFHLAGTNRSTNKKKFDDDNYIFTKKIISNLNLLSKNTPIIFSSSIMANDNSIYGKSKYKAEQLITKYNFKNKTKSRIIRLTNIFGKWSKPDYNSVVATFCYRLNRNMKINIFEKDKKKFIKLIYIDDLVDYFIKIIKSYPNLNVKSNILIYKISLKKLSEKLIYYKNSIEINKIPNLKNSFEKKLYSTYLSFMPIKKFTSKLNFHEDNRVFFSEIFKNDSFGQISMFSINPNKTRGNYFHNTKTETFIVIQGKVVFYLKNLNTMKIHQITIASSDNKLIKIPSGYNHKIKNIHKNRSLVLVWANEIFNKINHETYTQDIKKYEI